MQTVSIDIIVQNITNNKTVLYPINPRDIKLDNFLSW